MFDVLTALHTELHACRRCVEAGYWVEAPPIFAGSATARLMVVGQAPGKVEASQTRPAVQRAGRQAAVSLVGRGRLGRGRVSQHQLHDRHHEVLSWPAPIRPRRPCGE